MEKLAAETESDQVPLWRPVPRQHARRSHCFFGSVADLKRVHGIGATKPQAPMLSAIWRIYFFECVRALRGLGLSSSKEPIVAFGRNQSELATGNHNPRVG